MADDKQQLDPQPGQWVLIRCKVVKASPQPENVIVELFSKSDQYTCHIRRDAVVRVVDPPWPEEPADGSVVLVAGRAWQRIGEHWWAAGRHESATWDVLVQDAWNADQDHPQVVSEP